MIRTSPFRLLFVVTIALGLILSTACASTVAATSGDRSPLEQAKLQYAAASLDYEAAMLSAQDLRRARLLDDAAWTIVESAQTNVRRYAPIVRSGLDLWEASGSKPDSLASALAKIQASAADVAAIVKAVKR